MNLKNTFRKLRKNRLEKKLLNEINSEVPKGINWKQGAIDYLSKIMSDPHGHSRHFELVKPFQVGPDYTAFYADLYAFMNIIEKLSLPVNARILEPGCGAGWVVHFLSKLGYSVTGTDISSELLDVARERIETDPYPPYENKPFSVKLLEHDIESKPLEFDEPFDCVLFMSTLHHLVNPMQAIRNATAQLKEDGLLAISEASAPEIGSVYEKENREIMEKYHTLERPYSRDQLSRVLEMCEFRHVRFYQPINGLFLPGQAGIRNASNQIMGRNWNLVIASRSLDKLPDAHIENVEQYRDGEVEFVNGFYDQEIDPDWGAFRWAGPEATLTCKKLDTISLKIQAVFMDPELSRMKIFVSRDGVIEHHLILTRDESTINLDFTDLKEGSSLVFMSDHVFRPDWYDLDDSRLMSFKCKLITPDSF